jgi:hypothetical protein
MMMKKSTGLVFGFGYCITFWLVSAFWHALKRA